MKTAIPSMKTLLAGTLLLLFAAVNLGRPKEEKIEKGVRTHHENFQSRIIGGNIINPVNQIVINW